MTQETKPPEKDDDTLRKKLPPLHVAAQVVSTLACTFLLSFLGFAGTLIGLAVGSVLSTTIPTVLEHSAGKSTSAARERYRRLRSHGVPPKVARQAVESQARREGHARRTRTAALAGLTCALVLVVSGSVLYGIERAAGKPAADIVTGHAGHGTTLVGSSYTPPSAPVVVQSGTPSAKAVPTASPSVSVVGPSTSPSATPSEASDSDSPSATPDEPAATGSGTPAPTAADTSPAVSPSASLTVAPSPAGS